MKRQFSRKPSTLRVPLWTLAGALFLFVMLLGIRVFLPGTFISLATPFWEAGSSLNTSVGSAFAGIEKGQALAQQNAALNEKVVTLQNENAVLTARAQDLTKLLGGQSESGVGSDSVVAGVLARPPESPYDTLVVGSGKDEGITIGAEVFAAGGIPIGTVQSVTTHSAIVELLSSPGRTTSGWAGESRTPVTLIGSGGGAFTATLPKAAAVSVGDSLYVPGPGAVPVGTVAHVDSDASSPTVVLDITPFVNIFTLTWVQISGSTS